MILLEKTTDALRAAPISSIEALAAVSTRRLIARAGVARGRDRRAKRLRVGL